MAEKITLGQMTLFILVSGQLLSGIGNFVHHIGSVYEDSLFARHFFDVMALENVIHEHQNPVVIPPDTIPSIEFRNVSFTYPGGQQALRGVSFAIGAGESVALVGQNGAGKTTLVKLLCRFYEPTEGEILINGLPLRQISLESWYACLGTLFQKFLDFHFSVRDNIQLGAPSIHDPERLQRAARYAGADEFIESLPQGYDTMLGREFEDGVELSGGQWQKLAIARAFFQHAPVLILDEPTSAVDAEAEQKIFENLKAHYSGRSLIFVSHRFSTVRNADRIVVIENGSVIEAGTHSDLVQQNGRYASMFNTQAKGYQ